MNNTTQVIVSILDGAIEYSLNEREDGLDQIELSLPGCDMCLNIYTRVFFFNDFSVTVKNIKTDINITELTVELNRTINVLKFIPGNREIDIHAQIPDTLLRDAAKGSHHALKALRMVVYELIQRYELALPYVIDRICNSENNR